MLRALPLKAPARPAAHAVCLALLASLGCDGTRAWVSPTSEARGRLLLEWSGGRLEALGRTTLPATVSQPGNAPLRYELRDASGAQVAHGEVDDPRHQEVEVFDDPLSPRASHSWSSAHLTLELPQVEGTLVLSAGGTEVARLRLTSAAWETLHQPLVDREQDVLSEPVKVYPLSDEPTLVNVLVLSEGYTESELPQFHADVETMVEKFAALPDYAQFAGKIAIYRQDVRSQDSGVDDPKAQLEVNTAFDFGFGDNGRRSRRCIFFNTQAAKDAARALGAELRAQAVVVLSNAPEYGGCALPGLIGVSRASQDSGRTLGHELAHAIFNLRDEYDYGKPADQCHVGEGTHGPNVSSTSELERLPWADLVLSSTQLPTPEDPDHDGLVGAFEGAATCSVNKWRPSLDCMMKSAVTHLCPVCRRELGRYLGLPLELGQRFYAEGGVASFGSIVGDGRSGPSGAAAFFERGALSWKPPEAPRALRGAVAGKWRELEGEQGPLGFAQADAAAEVGPEGGGTAFEHGGIYRASAQAPAVAVYGPIHDAWQRRGGATGALGWPQTDVTRLPNGQERCEFERGAMEHDPASGRVTVYRR